MKILVTGGLGHIGSRFIAELSKSEDVELVRVLDNFTVQRYCSLFNLPETQNYEFIEGDIRNQEDLKKSMQDIDAVYHLAAITDAPSTIDIPELTNEVNFEATKKVIDQCLKSGVKKLVFPSTTSVYGPATGVIDEEYSNYNPLSPYAVAKIKSEEVLINAYKDNGLDTTVLRLGTIFGKSIGMRFHTAVNKFVYLACMGRPLTVWENALDQKRPYLDLTDAINAFSFVLNKKETAGQIFNVLTENTTVQNVVDIIKEKIPNVGIELTKSPILNQTSYNVSPEKLIKLGFKYEGNMRQSIHDTISLFKTFVR